MNTKKSIAAILCFALITSLLFSGCGSQTNNTTTPTSSTAVSTAATTAATTATSVQTAATTAKKTAAEIVKTEIATTKKSDYTTAQIFIQRIKCGWNLGNTLEATNIRNKTMPSQYTVNDIETGWGNPTTTKAMIDTVKKAGFNAVRIPVSWCRFISESNGKYSIRADFMKRVKQVVDYAYNNGMFVIINMHHDDAYDEWLHISGTDKEFSAVKNEYKQLWTAIANNFKSYGEKLILEAANEPIGYDSDGTADWWGNEDLYFIRLNELYKIFVDTVRGTGGNNKTRYLMLPTYGAQCHSRQYVFAQRPNNDPKIIIDIHYYTESTNQSEINAKLTEIAEYGKENGIAFIIGECGIRASNSDEKKVAWANAFVKTASQKGLRCFIWDDGGDYTVLEREDLSWSSPAMVTAFTQNAVVMKIN